MPTLTATSRVTPNDIQVKIVRIPSDLRKSMPEPGGQIEIRLDGSAGRFTLPVKPYGRLGNPTDLYRAIPLLKETDRGIEVRPAAVSWTFDPQALAATVSIEPDGEWRPLKPTATSSAASGPTAILSAEQEDHLRDHAERYVAEPVWVEQMQQRQEVSRDFRLAIEQSGILRGSALITDQLAELVKLVWKVENLNAMAIPRLLGTYAYHRCFNDFSGTRDDFIAHMVATKADWDPTSAGHEGADPAQVGRDLAAMLQADDARLGLAVSQFMTHQGAGRALTSGLLLLWEPTRHSMVNSASTGPFENEAAPLYLTKPLLKRLEEQARERFGLPSGGAYTRVARLLSWMLVFEAVGNACGLSSFFEVDWLLWRMSREAKGKPEAWHVSDDGVSTAQDSGRRYGTPEELAAATDELLPPARIEERRQAAREAREVLEQRRGQLTEEDLRKVLRLFNVDLLDGKKRFDRFSMGFTGATANKLVDALDEVNRWTSRVWEAEGEELELLLTEAWAKKVIPSAKSMLSMVLHVRDPERFAPVLASLARGYRTMTGQHAAKSGAHYRAYNEFLREFRTTHGLSAYGVDVLLSQVDRLAKAAEAAAKTSRSATTAEPDDETVAEPDPYPLDDLLADTLLGRTEVEELQELLADKPQLVLYGPPGTGKTYLAERLAKFLAGARGKVRTVQFHPSYGYEDFVEGIRPTLVDGQTTYGVAPGIFRRLCEEARPHPDQTYVLIVDEINRGNLPRIFGELLYLLERREVEHVELPVSGKQFSIPKNIILLGTMNTADHSIALVDVALRRRFHFKRLHPNVALLRRWLKREVPEMVGVASLLRRLNEELHKEGIDDNLWIGHSHFMDLRLDERRLQRVWEHSILPTLEEYFYGKSKKLQRFTWSEFVDTGIFESPEAESGTDDDDDGLGEDPDA